MINSKILAQTLIKISKSEDGEKLVKEFFNYLKKKNFLGLLPQVKKHLERSFEKSLKTQTLIINTKHEITDLEKNEIISLVGAEKNVEVKMVIDETILGGFSVTYNGNIYDGSLRNQITQLKTKLRT